MSKLSRFMSRTWSNLNPVEPSSLYLLKFMAIALTLFTIAYFIGQ